MKTRATLYTMEQRANAQANIARYGWAREQRDRAVAAAAPWLEDGPEKLWERVTGQTIPRSYAVASTESWGCLRCGKAVHAFGNYPYTADIRRQPWKLTCPACGQVFPTNDFAAYYQGGLDSQGRYLAERARAANDKLIAAGQPGNLVNLLAPDQDAIWGVDDGSGYRDPQGRLFTFVAAYNHWHVWYVAIAQTLDQLAEAYLLTGERAYADCGIALLDRVADVYPTLHLDDWPVEDGYLNSNGGTSNRGKATGSIWECGLAERLARAVDAFFPALAADAPPDVRVSQSILDMLARRSHCPEKTNVSDILLNLETGICRAILPAVQRAEIDGNQGMHQATLAVAGVVLDQLPETRELLDFAFRRGIHRLRYIGGGNIDYILTDLVDRDGHGNEASPGYNAIWPHLMFHVADALDGYRLEGVTTHDLFQNAKFCRMIGASIPMIQSGRFTPTIGDTGSTGLPLFVDTPQFLLSAWQHTRDPKYAIGAWLLNGKRTDGLHGSIFAADPENIAAEVAAIVSGDSAAITCGRTRPDCRSIHMPDYGFAALRHAAGTPRERDLWLYHGRNTGHGHRDTLNFGLYQYGLDLLPDLGYPRYANQHDMHRASFVINTITHNTVTVDDAPGHPHENGRPHHFADEPEAALLDVEANPVLYPQTDLYRRSMAWIPIDDDSSYAVDIFRVRGGRTHRYSFHTAESERSQIQFDGLNLVPQVETTGERAGQFAGTLAGPDVAYDSNRRDPTGLSYFFNVARHAGSASDFIAEFPVRDTRDLLGGGAHAMTDIRLRFHWVGDVDDAALTESEPPNNKVGNPKTLPYLILSRFADTAASGGAAGASTSSPGVLASCFRAVLEASRGGNAKIRAVSAAKLTDLAHPERTVDPMNACALRIELANGRTDLVFCALDDKTWYRVADTFDCRGFFALHSRFADGSSRIFLHDAETPEMPQRPRIRGHVLSATDVPANHNEIVVAVDDGLELADPAQLAGQFVYIQPNGSRNAVYQIENARLDAGVLTLDVGSTTTIHSYVDSWNPEAGYQLFFDIGAECEIPLSRCHD